MTEQVFDYVFIPAAADAPIEIKQFPSSLTIEDDRFVAMATEHFKSQGSVDRDVLRQNVLSHLKDRGATAGVSEDMMDRMSQMSSVEIFPITVPAKDLNHIAVSLYIDDKGVAKGSPINARATELVRACGHNTLVRGDAFVSRYFDNEEDWRRINFDVSDLDSSAGWIAQAKAFNSRTASQPKPDFLQSPSAPAPNEGTTSWGKWSQTDDEVELTVVVPGATKSRDVKVVFKHSTVSLTAPGGVSLSLGLWSTVEVDGCAWTIESSGDERQVIVTLAKASRGPWLGLEKQ
eukprot:c1542_g1_i1.p1 GENE.c1542_g1_i1~~c1542_g1_i1.p1  ORF type:complete len:305 (+),score=67.08 c1542_g1_i1:47-916(+)